HTYLDGVFGRSKRLRPRLVACIALSRCTCLTSPQVGECTSKFVVEGACASRVPCTIRVKTELYLFCEMLS
ncbi:hypothetical protein NC653_023697, partial [Populus alba x Populus x berolinensis]